jgi:predicted esterase
MKLHPLRLRVAAAVAAGILCLSLFGGEAPAPTAAGVKLFDYDRAAPLDVREISTELREDASIKEITFVGVKDPIKATIVAPAAPGHAFGGVLYVHWLGERATTNRSEFLSEAIALASQGMVSLLVDAMWSQPHWYDHRIPEEDYAHSIQQVIELRRALDLLLSQPGVDPRRVAYVGHDFGAMYGAVMGAVDGRPSTYVLMAGTPHLIDWYLFARQPKDLAAYRAQLAPLDPVRFVGQLAPATIFFQFASTDQYVTSAAAAEFYEAAKAEKHLATYEAGHDLQKASVTSDRVAWLLRRLRQ